MPDDSLSLKLYRRLLRFYPAGFRENYGEPLEREFRDELRESRGRAALGRLWVRLIADLAISIPAQLAREAAQDASHTFRLWARRPWHTTFAILALAVGIGANTGVFSVVNALLLRSLPFQEPGRLAALTNFFAPHDSVKQFHDWRAQSSYLADTALFETFDVNLGGAGEWRRAHAAQVSWNFFAVLGAQPVLGRGFAPGDDANGTGWGQGGRNAVTVISYGLWQALYGGGAKALGATIRVDGHPLTVVGIAPPGFEYPSRAALWKPAAFSPGNNGWEVIARLKPGITWPQARQAFAAEAERLWPNRTPHQRIQFPSRMNELRDELAGPTKKASLVLMACVVLILLLACTNVANLLLARTADRAMELSIRSALGASRARLSQQLLTECVLLSLAASVAGIVVAIWAASLAAKVQPAPIAAQEYSILDGRVLFFTIAVSLFSGLLFGLLPSLYAGRAFTFEARGSGCTHGSRLLRESLIAAQVVLTLVLLVSSLSVGRAFAHLMHTDRGFAPQGLVTVNVSLEGTIHGGGPRGLSYFQQALDRVRRLPGVHSASATEFLPLYANGFIGGTFSMDGRRASESSMVVPVMPDYFQTMGGQILAGREFTEAELRGNAKLAIVNERFASEFGPPADAVGHTIAIGSNSPRTIVGVAKGMDYTTNGANGAQVFVPSQSPGGFFSTIVVRVDGRAEEHLSMVRDAIQSVDPTVPVFGAKTMQQRLEDALARPQFYRTAVVCFTSFGLLLVVIGIYGVVSYAVTQRTHEMGVRMALGTTPSDLRGAILRQGLVTVGAGAVPGVAAAFLSGRFLEGLVEGAKPADAASYAASVLVIAAIAAAGIWAATRPIARLDIIEILRSE
ncbi:ADOP family duplicated permease [uncultured Paludibaculum sp.]|uniref:ADOP family duplicated permease n=1 Tax=uncultured Paludibaculum sp. TaxID=1765020 RepID=UPI002AAB277E|nr:ADOP family duplicated permease [uncultured Paludibaculum sp.]